MSARCYVIRPQWTDGGRLARPNIVTLPATRGFGLARDPRDLPPPERPDPEPKGRGSWRWWRRQ
jgi:hypothetical protein